MFNFMAFWGNYWEGIVAALIVCIISIILQIPYAEDDAPDPGESVSCCEISALPL